MGSDTQRILRVGIIQSGKIVEERLLRKKEDVTIGQGPRNTFIVPEAKIPKSYTIFEFKGGEYTLVFEKRMDGRVSTGDDILDLKGASKSGSVQRKGNHFFLPLSTESRGKIVMGDVTVLFQFVDAPQVLPKPHLPAAARAGLVSRIDWTFAYILLLTAILLGGGGIGSDVWWRQTGQYLEVQYEARKAQMYEMLRAETLLEKQKEEEEKKKEEEDKPEEIPVAEAAEAAEPEEEVKPQKKRKRRSGATKRQTKTMKGDASSRAKKKTFLHVLGSEGKGGMLANTLKGGLSSDKIAGAFTGLDGKGITMGGDGEGGDGPNLAPEVKGGGTGSYKGLSGKDVGGKRITSKKVRTASKDSGGERKIKARVGSGKLSGQTGSGTIDKASVARVFRRRKGAIKYCYEKALKTNPKIKGKVGIRFKIGTAGRVTSISTTSNSTGDGSIGSCIKGKVKSWRFPPATGGSVTFSHTFVLSSS